MPEHDIDKLAELIAEKIATNHRADICPLGLSYDDARKVVRLRKFFAWSGMLLAGTLIVSFASGFIALLVYIVRLVLVELGLDIRNGQ